jgi:hypothetical protein
MGIEFPFSYWPTIIGDDGISGFNAALVVKKF